jgi:hypothetical protein
MARDEEFLTGVVDPIEGWLLRPAAHLTIQLLRTQRDMAIEGSLLEIGIYNGKYFAILLDDARSSGSCVVGVDTFEFTKRDAVERDLRARFPDVAEMVIHEARSDALPPDDYLEKLGSAPRFMSIDGSHNAPDVLHDLALADHILSNTGIVALDDFANPRTLGVNEAAARFFLSARRLVPFCYCTNKLFLCRPSRLAFYMEASELFVRANLQYRECREFVELEAKWRGSVETEYFRNKLLTIF